MNLPGGRANINSRTIKVFAHKCLLDWGGPLVDESACRQQKAYLQALGEMSVPKVDKANRPITVCYLSRDQSDLAHRQRTRIAESGEKHGDQQCVKPFVEHSSTCW